MLFEMPPIVKGPPWLLPPCPAAYQFISDEGIPVREMVDNGHFDNFADLNQEFLDEMAGNFFDVFDVRTRN